MNKRQQRKVMKFLVKNGIDKTLATKLESNRRSKDED